MVIEMYSTRAVDAVQGLVLPASAGRHSQAMIAGRIRKSGCVLSLHRCGISMTVSQI
jgi:hypothetical protein